MSCPIHIARAVSIRTPVKGVIIDSIKLSSGGTVSIRTPVKGVMRMKGKTSSRSMFQSAPP